MTPERATPDAVRLLLQGSLALADVEHNGMRVDLDYLDRAGRDIDRRLADAEQALWATDVGRLWRKTFPRDASLGSPIQMAEVVFNKMGFKPPAYTEKSYDAKGRLKANPRPKLDKHTFERIELPFLRDYEAWKELGNAKGTFLGQIKREVVDGRIHPVINLNTVRTYRSSCDSPNLQNMPIRDETIGPLIRRCFIPSDGCRLVEVDFSALEFKIAACFWRCPEMVKYASDPTKDVHRDQAADCYGCRPKEVSKEMRFFAKNQFVFPTLYGSWWKKTAAALWEAMGKHKLKLTDGTYVEDHLNTKLGITELGDCDPSDGPARGTYEYHVREVERRFMGRFPGFGRGKKPWLEKYRERGWFRLMTGFVVAGELSNNDCLNYPVQGPAFHLMLESLIRMIVGKFRRLLRQMGGKIVNTIHDCLIGDVPERNVPDFIEMAVNVMTVEIPRDWSWVIVPLGAEVDVTPAGGSWADKSPWIREDGKWRAK